MNQNPPINVVLQTAKNELIKTTNIVMQTYGLPACLIDGLLTSILADIRSQEAAELVKDINATEGSEINE